MKPAPLLAVVLLSRALPLHAQCAAPPGGAAFCSPEMTALECQTRAKQTAAACLEDLRRYSEQGTRTGGMSPQEVDRFNYQVAGMKEILGQAQAAEQDAISRLASEDAAAPRRGSQSRGGAEPAAARHAITLDDLMKGQSDLLNAYDQQQLAPATPPKGEDGAAQAEDGFWAGVAAVANTAAGLEPRDARGAKEPPVMQAFRAGDHRTIARLAEEVVKREPESAPARGLLARARLAAGDMQGAKAAAREALALDPTDPVARMISGQAESLAAGEARVNAMTIGFDDKGGLDPATTAKLAEAGAKPGVVVSAQQREGAERVLAALAAGVSPADTPSGKAQALLQQAASRIAVGDLKSPDGALVLISRALMHEPKNVRARVLRAHVSNLPLVRNYDAAVLDANEALKLSPQSAAALFERGYAELQLGKLNEALRSIEDGLALEPDNAMGRLYHAMVLEKANLIGKAVDEYRAAARLDPALKPVVDEALGRIAGGLAQARSVATEAPKGRTIPTKPLLWALLLISALALLLEGGKRVFYKDWKTTVQARPDADLPETAKGTLQPGALLGGNFRIEGELARGGIGIVYKAEDVTLKREVAIKHLNRQAYESGEVRSRFVKEAQLAARLRHPNLAEIFSVVNDEELFLVFELVDGESLAQTLQRRMRLQLPEVKAIVADVAAALDYAHSQRVIHRDLKPANVMRRPDGRCKIMDFGIAHEARTMTDQTQTQAWGTPPYMAPEQELGRVSKESDHYALGVMVYELLCGQRPFDGAAALERKLRGEFRPIQRVQADLPGELHAFFKRALDPEPSKRFASAAELSRALDAVEATPLRA